MPLNIDMEYLKKKLIWEEFLNFSFIVLRRI